ncbi:MAG: (d)CMP kinase [Clostridia bacterium]|nr:(d)CMP kinase [Clostridia bacterium]
MGTFAMLCARIEALMKEKPHVLVAIDGPAASGKTTLAAHLAGRYGAQTLHMDDYFLQTHQRTPERYAQPGGNVDRERFLEEVLLPLSGGAAYVRRRFDCAAMTLLEGETVQPGRLTVIEGSYSLHPVLAPRYDLRVLLTVDACTQSARILARNGEEKHRQFMERWVPLENRYFEQTRIEERADMLLTMGEEA